MNYYWRLLIVERTTIRFLRIELKFFLLFEIGMVAKLMLIWERSIKRWGGNSFRIKKQRNVIFSGRIKYKIVVIISIVVNK